MPLNMVVAAITLCNTAYLDARCRRWRNAERQCPTVYLPHISPVGWEHIGITGTYTWGARPSRPLRVAGTRQERRIVYWPFCRLVQHGRAWRRGSVESDGIDYLRIGPLPRRDARLSAWGKISGIKRFRLEARFVANSIGPGRQFWLQFSAWNLNPVSNFRVTNTRTAERNRL